MAKVEALLKSKNMRAQKHYIFKIVLTGPESSGKTRMAKALAEHLQTTWVPEFARAYLAHPGRAYDRSDLPYMARGQRAWEDWYRADASKYLICDTDWTVFHIWEAWRFGSPPDGQWAWARAYAGAAPADLYLLCSPDFPWEPDPLREHPEVREALFQEYEKLLRARELPFFILSGLHEERLRDALSKIGQLY